MDKEINKIISLMERVDKSFKSELLVEDNNIVQSVQNDINNSYGDLSNLYTNIRISDYVNYPQYHEVLNSMGYFYDGNNLLYIKNNSFEELYNNIDKESYYSLIKVIMDLNKLNLNKDFLNLLFGENNVYIKDKYLYIFFEEDCFIVTPKKVIRLYHFQGEKIFSSTIDPQDKKIIYERLSGNEVIYIGKKEVIFKESDGVYSYFKKGSEVEFLSYNTPAENYGLIYNSIKIKDNEKMNLFKKVSNIIGDVTILQDDNYIQWIFKYNDDGEEKIYMLYPDMLNQSENVTPKDIWYLNDRLPNNFLK